MTLPSFLAMDVENLVGVKCEEEEEEDAR